jgi:fructoselysine transporter
LLILGGLGFVFSLLFRLGEVITAILAMRILVQFVGQAVGLVLLRRRQGTAHLPFRMPLYPLPVVVAVVVWLLIFWSTGPTFMLSGLTVISTGIVVFLLWSRRRRQWPFAPK